MTTAPAPLEDYQARFSGSAALHGRAARVLAGGAAHDLWDTHPFPVYFERAKGPCKWDHENNRFIDFWTGHGAHLCGHAFEPVQEAVAIRLGMGTHLTAPAEAQILWAEQVCALVPSAERVRFTSSGTEATMLALRVARAHTGRRHVIKFDGHFHGWHDEVLSDYSERSAAGRHPLSGELRSLFPCTDIAAACRRMEHRDVAALILEPGGGSSGALPWSPEDLRALREAATRTGTVLVFDEVVSGFRYRPGGVQELAGVTPDLTALGKILGGGFPERPSPESARSWKCSGERPGRSPPTAPRSCTPAPSTRTCCRPPPAPQCWKRSPTAPINGVRNAARRLSSPASTRRRSRRASMCTPTTTARSFTS